MGGPCEVLVETEREQEARQLAEAVTACAERIERKYSRYRSDNIVAQINGAQGTPVTVDEETANLLDFSGLLHSLSGGMFDVTSGVLRRAWSFDGRDRIPTREDVDALLSLVGWQKIHWTRPVVSLLPGMQIDLGGVAKEYAVDQAVRAASIVSPVPTLVNFGGDLAVTRARSGGQPWRVGIEGIDEGLGASARLVDLAAGALATSGDTYRYVKSGGRRLPHILDPRNGHPIEGAPRTVTVAASNCTQAGMFTTLAMLKGPGAEAFLESEGIRFWIQRDAATRYVEPRTC
jgi:thiamine biosynthesis lipoprotein